MCKRIWLLNLHVTCLEARLNVTWRLCHKGTFVTLRLLWSNHWIMERAKIQESLLSFTPRGWHHNRKQLTSTNNKAHKSLTLYQIKAIRYPPKANNAASPPKLFVGGCRYQVVTIAKSLLRTTYRQIRVSFQMKVRDKSKGVYGNRWLIFQKSNGL